MEDSHLAAFERAQRHYVFLLSKYNCWVFPEASEDKIQTEQLLMFSFTFLSTFIRIGIKVQNQSSFLIL